MHHTRHRLFDPAHLRGAALVAASLWLTSIGSAPAAPPPLPAASVSRVAQDAPATPRDREILRALNEGRAYTLSDHDVRLEHPASFPETTLVGFFANDRGYSLEAVFIGLKRYTPKEAAPLVLASAGWSKRSGAAREKLALAYETEVRHAFGATMLTSCPEDLGRQGVDFTPPVAKGLDDGGVEVRYWSQAPAGMRPVSTYHLHVDRFSADGQVRGSVERSLEVPFKGH